MTTDSDTVTVSETGQGKYQVEARMGTSAFLLDEPVSAGGWAQAPILTRFWPRRWAPAPP